MHCHCSSWCSFLLRHRPATDMAALVDQNRSDRRVFAQQCRMADCGAVLMGATDDPVRMRTGMIQIKMGARQPPKEFALGWTLLGWATALTNRLWRTST